MTVAYIWQGKLPARVEGLDLGQAAACDLSELVEIGALRKQGGGRSVRYELAP